MVIMTPPTIIILTFKRRFFSKREEAIIKQYEQYPNMRIGKSIRLPLKEIGVQTIKLTIDNITTLDRNSFFIFGVSSFESSLKYPKIKIGAQNRVAHVK